MRVPHGILAWSLLVLSARPAGGQDPTGLRFTSLSAGGAHTCGITADSIAYCWGRNEFGQLGDSSNTDRPAPVRVSGGLAFRLISAGDGHTCAVATDDTPYCWGKNNHGQLGIGSTGTGNYPQDITFPARRMGRMRVSAIFAGTEHTCALIIHREQQDRAYCWGDDTKGQVGTRGQMGRASDVFTPTATFGVIRYANLGAGGQHTCGVALSVYAGGVFCWGANGRGQLGVGSRTDSPVPFAVRGNRTYSIVTAGTTHTCALATDGQPYCWGDNSAGQLGTGKGGTSINPARLGDTLRFTAIDAGGDATCAVRADGGASCWGSNATGQFGTGATTGSPTPVPAVPGLTLTAITLGRAHGCGLQSNGAAYCWGQLAGGPDTAISAPRLVTAQPIP